MDERSLSLRLLVMSNVFRSQIGFYNKKKTLITMTRDNTLEEVLSVSISLSVLQHKTTTTTTELLIVISRQHLLRTCQHDDGDLCPLSSLAHRKSVASKHHACM